MTAPLLSISRRVRRTPFTDRVTAAGVKAYTVYNHMLLPTVFDDLIDDYHHLKKHVQIWDVACQRQIELRGPDAGRLAQMLTPRDLRPLSIRQCFYTPMVDETGGMLNDPVTLKLADDRYWISIADSDLLLWIKGLAYGFRLEVDVAEPDVSPLGVQGPKADDVMERVFGPEARNIRFFRFAPLPFGDQQFLVARSGYSKQGGFEIYVDGSEHGPRLWDALLEAGEDLEIRAGGPNLIERIEGGLLSYGNDMTRENTPHECGLGRFCDTMMAIGCVGRDALLRVVMQGGPTRAIRSLAIDGDPVSVCGEPWPIIAGRNRRVGQVTSAAWSPDFNTNVALGMIASSHWRKGQKVKVETPDGLRDAMVRDGSFV